MPTMECVRSPIPTLHREAEAWSANFYIRPAINALGCKKRCDTCAGRHQLPTAIGLLADQFEPGARHPETECACFGDDRLWSTVPVEVLHLLDCPRRIAGRAGVVAFAPLPARSGVSGCTKCCRLIFTRQCSLSNGRWGSNGYRHGENGNDAHGQFSPGCYPSRPKFDGRPPLAEGDPGGLRPTIELR